MAKQWFALRCKPRKEEVVWRQLKLLETECFFPRLRVNPVNPRARKLVPYFPGYMFVHLDLDENGASAFQWMPHTLGMVSYGSEPAAVPDHLVAEMRKRVAEISAAGGEIFVGLQPGEVVVIQDGPFRGFEAIFDTRLPGSERVRVLLELITNPRQVPLELQVGQIARRRAEGSRPAQAASRD